MEQYYERGDIKFKGRAKQINSFAGLIRRRNITPTDIDGIIDYGGKAFIILEGKYGDAELPKGQKMALENLANTILEAKKKSLVIVYRHYVHNVNDDINVSKQLVSDIYFKKKWFEIGFDKTVLQIIEIFEKDCDSKNFVL